MFLRPSLAVLIIVPVFDLPEEILKTLTLKDQGCRPIEETQSNTPTPSNESTGKPEPDGGGPAKATLCNLCSLTFPTVQEQRSHVQSDLHRYNLKQKMRGLKPVGEAEFEKLIERQYTRSKISGGAN